MSILFTEENGMANLPSQLQQLILNFSSVIGTAPTAESFTVLVLGWILCHGRRTVSGVIRAAGPEANKSHDAYQNFFSKSRWSMGPLWEMLFRLLVKVFVTGVGLSRRSSDPVIWIAGDDTLSKHYGRKIWGAGLYRDAVRSSKKHTAYAWGLNWVVLAMIVKVPLLKERFIALPIYARLNPKHVEEEEGQTANRRPRKSKGRGKRKATAKGKGSKRKKTTVSIMQEMVQTVASWVPHARFIFCGDGAYACLAGHLPSNVQLVSRMRCDAALYGVRPPPTNKAGRPAQKGKRLPSPQKMAQRVGTRWETHEIEMYGRIVERQLYTFSGLWYEVCPDHLVKIVIVRDPEGKDDDEYFFTTDLDMSAEGVALCYTGRWAIEVAFRETKQYLGMGEPQARKKEAVLRITPFCLWLNSLVKVWFVLESRQTQPALLGNDPWYAHKDTISFQDMLGAIRLHFWRKYISTGSTSRKHLAKIRRFIVESLARVA
jgi:hypothetical protein